MEFDFSKQVQNSAKLTKAFADEKERKEMQNRPDGDFAYIKEGGSKDEMGRTVPRSLRQFPVWTELKIRRSVEELGKSFIPSEAKAESFINIHNRAKKLQVEVSEEQALGAERFDGKKRSELPDSAFLDPKRRSFPVVSCKNVKAAVSTWGMYKGSMSFDEFKSKLKARAKKLGCESSLPKTWTSESGAKDWEKTDKKELKRDDKKEKKEHHKDAVEDDESKLKKLKKDKPSEKKSVETHDLKKDIRYDKKKEAAATSDKQKAAKEKFLEMIRKKKGGDKKDDDKKDDDKKDGDKKKDDDKKESKAGIPDLPNSAYNTRAPVNNLDINKERVVMDTAETDRERHEKMDRDEDRQDKKELGDESLREKIKHHKDAIKNLEKEISDLKKDKKEDKGDVKSEMKKSTAPLNCPTCY